MEQTNELTGRMRRERRQGCVCPVHWHIRESIGEQNVPQPPAGDGLFVDVTEDFRARVQAVLFHTSHAPSPEFLGSSCIAMRGADVMKVYQVQNKVRWAKYLAAVTALKQEHRLHNVTVQPLIPSAPEILTRVLNTDISINELTLMHGTGVDAALQIARFGVDERVSQGIYGSIMAAGCISRLVLVMPCNTHH